MKTYIYAAGITVLVIASGIGCLLLFDVLPPYARATLFVAFIYVVAVLRLRDKPH
jgi:hypothetical protein